MVMNLPCAMVPFPDGAFIVHLTSIIKQGTRLQGTFKLEYLIFSLLFYAKDLSPPDFDRPVLHKTSDSAKIM